MPRCARPGAKGDRLWSAAPAEAARLAQASRIRSRERDQPVPNFRVLKASKFWMPPPTRFLV